MSARILEGGGLLGGYSFDAAQRQDPNSRSPGDSTNEPSAGRKLLVKLERVHANYRNAGSPDASRKHSISALEAILEHLPEILPDAKLSAIQDLVWQLVDDITGHSSSATQSTQAVLLRSYSAAYMSALMDRKGAAMSEDEANAQAKAESTRWAARIGIDLAPSTIQNWRKARQSRRANAIELHLYDVFSKQWRGRPRELRTAANARDWYRETTKAVLGD